MKTQPIFGRRMIKTAIAVFLTALICLSFQLPAKFAVIAAIVTIEPTASDSIRKGVIRFPASAIGAAFAVLFAYLAGDSVISYTGAAFLTILTCQKLKLHDGILVATLTAVAMIPDIEGNFLISLFSRLGTTFIGLSVASLINLYVLPPKFVPIIKTNLLSNFHLVSNALEESVRRIVLLEQSNAASESNSYNRLKQSVEKTNGLFLFQEREWKYHKVKVSEYRTYNRLKKTNVILQKIVLHLGNLHYINEPAIFFESEIRVINETIFSLKTILNDGNFHIPVEHYSLIEELDQKLKQESTQNAVSPEFFHHFTTKRILYFELLSIHDSVEELNHLCNGAIHQKVQLRY